MYKKIIQIDSEKCVGCSLCVNTCHQSAIELVDGKAKVVRDDFCDGLGRCLPVCPVSAIKFSEVEIQEKTSEETQATQNLTAFKCPSTKMSFIEPEKTQATQNPTAFKCPSTEMSFIQPEETQATQNLTAFKCPSTEMSFIQPEKTQETQKTETVSTAQSQLRQWPIQISLVPTKAPYFSNANLLISADCSAFSYSNFHEEFMKDNITIIGCPKLDDVDYSNKLTSIISENDIKFITVVRMEVPCCKGIETATLSAIKNSKKAIPHRVVTLSTTGKILI